MTQKKLTYFITILLILITIIIGINLLVNYKSTVDVRKENELIHFIEQTDKVRNISIVKQSDYQELHCVLYTLGGYLRLFILEKSIIPNRYIYYGGAGGTNRFRTYNFADSKGVLIIVYGDNTEIQANTYTMKNSTITYTENIHNMDYVLRVYRIPDSYNLDSDLCTFDANETLISEY